MKEHPMLFSGEMVRALLSGEKTQTRRVITRRNTRRVTRLNPGRREPRVQPGDRIWGRETLCIRDRAPADPLITYAAHVVGRPTVVVQPQANLWAEVKISKHYERTRDPIGQAAFSIPSIFMPRWACRIWLDVMEVREEALQDISNEDAIAEGCPGFYAPCHPDIGETDGQQPWEEYSVLWDSINARDGTRWRDNPAVWVYTFEVRDVHAT